MNTALGSIFINAFRSDFKVLLLTIPLIQHIHFHTGVLTNEVPHGMEGCYLMIVDGNDLITWLETRLSCRPVGCYKAKHWIILWLHITINRQYKNHHDNTENIVGQRPTNRDLEPLPYGFMMVRISALFRCHFAHSFLVRS